MWFVFRWERKQPEDWWLWQRSVLCADPAHQAGTPFSLTVFCVSSVLCYSLHWQFSSWLQETFDAGLQAFQQEGITNITALKDQLLAAKHVQSKAIEARHAALIKRWNQLLSNSAARKKKLLEAQEHFRKVKRPEDSPVEEMVFEHTFVHAYKNNLLPSYPRWKTCFWHLPKRPQPSTAGLRMQRRILQTQWGATLWRRSGHFVKPMRPSVPHLAQLRPTSTSWLSWTSRLRATKCCLTPTPGSPWRPWKRPGGTCRRSSRFQHQTLYTLWHVYLISGNSLDADIPNITADHIFWAQMLSLGVLQEFSSEMQMACLLVPKHR